MSYFEHTYPSLTRNTFYHNNPNVYFIIETLSVKMNFVVMILFFIIDVSALNAKVNDMRNLMEVLLDGQASIIQQSGFTPERPGTCFP